MCQRLAGGEGAEATDNALSAVASMIVHGADVVPLDVVVPPFLAALPLHKDLCEYQAIIDCIAFLLEREHPAVMNDAPKVVAILVGAIKSEEIPASCETLVRRLFREFASMFADSVNELPDDDKRLLTEFLSAQEAPSQQV